MRDIGTIDAEPGARGSPIERLLTEHRVPRKLLDERAAALLPLGGTETFLGEPRMRDIETIDGELRLLAREWCVARDLSGCTPDTALIDRLLDERAATAVG